MKLFQYNYSKLKHIGAAIFILVLCMNKSGLAQDVYYEDYDYEDYDYGYHSVYYSTEEDKDDKYKRSYKEYELYNNTKRRSSQSSGASASGGWFSTLFGTNGKDDEITDHSDVISQPATPKKLDRFNTDPLTDDRNIGLHESYENTTKEQPGKGEKPGDDGGKHMEGPPTVPDEPDVPVDSAIPFLIVAGIGLASVKFYLSKKKASV